MGLKLRCAITLFIVFILILSSQGCIDASDSVDTEIDIIPFEDVINGSYHDPYVNDTWIDYVIISDSTNWSIYLSNIPLNISTEFDTEINFTIDTVLAVSCRKFEGIFRIKSIERRFPGIVVVCEKDFDDNQESIWLGDISCSFHIVKVKKESVVDRWFEFEVDIVGLNEGVQIPFIDANVTTLPYIWNESYRVFRSHNSWTEFINDQDYNIKHQNGTEINYSTHMIVAAFFGYCGSTGYDIIIDDIVFVSTMYLVKVRKQFPTGDVGWKVTTPSHIVIVPIIEGHVVFDIEIDPVE
jgi:hypothetical protein